MRLFLKLIKFFDKIIFSSFFYNKRKFDAQRQAHTRYISVIKDLRQLRYSEYWRKIIQHIKVNNIEGDIVECGVGNGESLGLILLNLKFNNLDKNYYGFDSFQGFPKLTNHDKPGLLKKNIEDSWAHTSSEYVLNNLKSIGFSSSEFKNVKFIKGFFEDSIPLNQKISKKISLLNIDCDIYESHKIVLKYFYPLVESKGIIAFDDIDSIYFPGAVSATKQFLGENYKNLKKCPFSGKHYLIKE